MTQPRPNSVLRFLQTNQSLTTKSALFKLTGYKQNVTGFFARMLHEQPPSQFLEESPEASRARPSLLHFSILPNSHQNGSVTPFTVFQGLSGPKFQIFPQSTRKSIPSPKNHMVRFFVATTLILEPIFLCQHLSSLLQQNARQKQLNEGFMETHHLREQPVRARKAAGG